jgi:hypothetical protein
VTWRLTVERGAQTEIAEAAAWYAERRADLREQFLAAVEGALDAVEQNPLQYQIVQDDVRRVLVWPFPYALLYSVWQDMVFVTVCVHTSRDPEYWQTRSSR